MFIVEWMLLVSEASNAQGSRVGIGLISPEGEVLEYSLWFTFMSSNNTMEYKALIIGLSITKKIKAQKFIAYNDS